MIHIIKKLLLINILFITSLFIAKAYASIPFPNLDPNAFTLFGFSVKWYGLFYLFGLISVLAINYLMLKFEHKNSDYNNNVNFSELFDIAINGFLCAVIGGRLGYVLFYNFSFYIHNPLEVLFVHKGGMSFHGGLLGAIIYLAYHFRNKKGFLQYADCFASTIPFALFLGRIANFINGELWGRVTDVSWSVVFPTGGDLPRHPSQLYEAALEGLVLFIILIFLRAFRIRKEGLLTGVFIVGYGIARFIVEFFREPDAQIGYYLDYFTQGQLLCLPMIFIGLYFICRRNIRNNH